MSKHDLHDHGIAFNFGALPEKHARWDKARVAILPVPYDLTTSYQPGARRGPQAIIEASTQLEFYDAELDDEPYQVGIHTLPALHPTVSGPKEMSKEIQSAFERVLDAGKFPVVLGGDHSVSHGVIQALAKRFEKFSVLQLDAHADLRDEYQGSKWSHACIGRRVVELKHARLVQIGIRSLSREEADVVKRKPENLFSVSAAALQEDPQAGLKALKHLQDPVYITIDVDAFDPSIMPATGTPEPGGLNWYQTLSLLHQTFKHHDVLGCDVVELAPLPGSVAPDFLTAKLVYKLIGYWKTFHCNQEVGP